ncbi:MAB_1171c family putative transporter [Streptomyces sp. NPDC006670]|uniref:MAB_1171c family putative transporter n=1 Tax=Streptomyces sp. NPDC006670 TaxID=3154476 RepID=UPI0034000642
MLTPHLAALGSWLTYPSCLSLCLAALLRAAPSLRAPDQRGLWLAVSTAGVAMVLDLPAVTGLGAELADTGHAVERARNLSGVVSAGAVLIFVSAPARSRRLRAALCGATAAVLAVLAVLDLSAPAHTVHSLVAAGGPSPSYAYWLTLIATHVAANSVCLLVCCRYGLRTNDRTLAWTLWLFTAGTAFAGLFWVGRLLRLVLDASWVLPYLPLFINLHAVLRATAILVPTAVMLCGALSDARTAWRLWPLWHDLVEAVPHVVLCRRRTRLLELLWPPLPRRLLAYRKLIEIRDAMLELDHYVPPGLAPLAREHVRAQALDPARADAAVLACLMQEARRAKLAGTPRRDVPAEPVTCGERPPRPARQEHTTALATERAHLIALAQAYASTPVRAFATLPPQPGDRDPRHEPRGDGGARALNGRRPAGRR